MPHVPQNGEEAAYTSFALVDALIDALIARDILDRGAADGIFSDAIRVLKGSPLIENSTQGERGRAADFIRHVKLGQK
jgi:hypothetical protein